MKECTGESHEWGTYTAPDKSWDNLLKLCRTLRAKAIDQSLMCPKPDMIQCLIALVIAHDTYHIGQMALLRKGSDAAMEPYSAYRVVELTA